MESITGDSNPGIFRRKLFKWAALTSLLAAGGGYLLKNIPHWHYANGRFLDDRDLPDPIKRVFQLPDESRLQLIVKKNDYLRLFDEPRDLFSQNFPQRYAFRQDVQSIADVLWNKSKSDKVVYVQNVMDFISLNFSYEADKVEFTKYPLETLVEGKGDCEDFAVLAASFFAAHDVINGIALSPHHAAVAISFDEFEEQERYPSIEKASTLFGTSKSIDTSHFDPKTVKPFSYTTIPKNSTYAQAERLWNDRFSRNVNEFGDTANLRLCIEGTNRWYHFFAGENYLTFDEKRILSLEEGIRVNEERRRADLASKGIYEVTPITNDVRPVSTRPKYIYLETTSGKRWRLSDGLPSDMTFFPLKPEQYKTPRK